MTQEQRKISNKNHKKAWDYFVSIGKIPTDYKPQEYVLHHKDSSWKENDIERYIQWNINDLIPMTRVEHAKLHALGKNSKKGEKNPLYGKKFSSEHREKLSKARMGKSPWNKGKKGVQKCSQEHKDRMANIMSQYKWFNNGTKNTRALECPEGYVEGRIKSHE